MIPSSHTRIAAAIGAAAAASLFAPTTFAADCASLPNPVYVTGSSAVKPFLVKLGAALSKASPAVTIVYKGQGSCNGPDAIVNGTKMTGTAVYWDGVASGDQSCDLDIAGQVADVGVSDVFAASCPNITPTASEGDFFGPVQVMNMVVPKASSQTSISAEAAYFVFGFGAAGKAAPWTDDNLIFRRNEQSGTQQMVAKAINVPANKWKGVDATGSGALLTKVTTSVDPEKTIGILASDLADENRDKLKLLAYQHYGQTCGFLPDSSPTSFDKKNVRDGHYPVWGPLHFFAKVGADKKPSLPAAKQLIGYFTGEPAPAGVNLLDLEIAAHTVPACAMRVTRSAELGELASYAPPDPCGCYFDVKATGSTTCATCTNDDGCPSKHCRHGYCEAYLHEKREAPSEDGPVRLFAGRARLRGVRR